MPLILSDEELATLGLNSDEVRVELACRLFQAGKIALWPAAKLAKLSRVEMEDALHERKIPAYVITAEDFRHDMEVLNRSTVSS